MFLRRGPIEIYIRRGRRIHGPQIQLLTGLPVLKNENYFLLLPNGTQNLENLIIFFFSF